MAGGPDAGAAWQVPRRDDGVRRTSRHPLSRETTMASHDELVAAFDAALTGGDPDAFVARARARRDRLAQPRPQGGRRAREHGRHRHARPARRRPDRSSTSCSRRSTTASCCQFVARGTVRSNGNPFEMHNCLDRDHHRRRADQPHRRVRRPDRGSAALMTMDVATNLDPEIARRARGVADRGDRLRHLHLRVAARRCARRWRTCRRSSCRPPRPCRTRWSCPARPATTRRCACTRRPPTATGRPCIYWIHGGGYMFGSGSHRRRPAQPLGRGVRLRRGVDRVPPRAGGPVPGAARRLLRGPAVDRAARRRAGHRPGPHRDRRRERGRRARRRSRHPRPRPRRGRRSRSSCSSIR